MRRAGPAWDGSHHLGLYVFFFAGLALAGAAGYFLELYQRRDFVRNRLLIAEQERSEGLLRNLLPVPGTRLFYAHADALNGPRTFVLLGSQKHLTFVADLEGHVAPSSLRQMVIETSSCEVCVLVHGSAAADVGTSGAAEATTSLQGVGTSVRRPPAPGQSARQESANRKSPASAARRRG